MDFSTKDTKDTKPIHSTLSKAVAPGPEGRQMIAQRVSAGFRPLINTQPREGRQNPFPQRRQHPTASPSHRKTKRISRKASKPPRDPFVSPSHEAVGRVPSPVACTEDCRRAADRQFVAAKHPFHRGSVLRRRHSSSFSIPIPIPIPTRAAKAAARAPGHSTLCRPGLFPYPGGISADSGVAKRTPGSHGKRQHPGTSPRF